MAPLGEYYSTWSGGAGCEEPKPKFKVGDKVIGNKKASAEYNMTVEGWQGYVTDVYKNYITVSMNRGDSSNGYSVNPECFDLVPDSQKSVTEFLAELKSYEYEYEIDAKKELIDNMYKALQGRLVPFNNLTKPTGIKKYMNNIVEFAKNLTLSDDEKVLQEVCLKDSEGNWTSSAIRIVQDLEAKELGYKDFRDLAKSFGLEGGSIVFSAFELAKAVKNREPRLLEIAREMKSDQEKNCKE